jgi:signal transduction histidine kinase/ActR/RegA family two-component response regulator
MVPTFLAGGGECGALLRAFPWSTTTVGPVETWPASLKTTVGTLLHSRHPMFLWWGPDLIQFYNDAYVPSFGKGKHPAAIGQPGAECWREIWPIIWPQIDEVMRNGTPSWNEDHLVPIYRNGRLEEVFWTYGYSPVFDDDGRIGGTLVVCTETTTRVLAERRLDSLRRLAEAASLAMSAGEVVERSAEVLAGAGRDVAFALFYTAVSEAAPRLLRTVRVSDDCLVSLDGQCRREFESMTDAAGTRAVPPAVGAVSGWPEPVSELFLAPIGAGGDRPAGFVVFGLSPRLPFDEHYRDYLLQIAQQITHAQARIEAFHVRAVAESERNNLLQQAPVATALMTGPRHVFQLANPLFHLIVGRHDIVGQAYLDAFPELRGTELPDILDHVYRTGEPFTTDEMLMPLDRDFTGVITECFFKFNLAPMRNAAGEVYGMMAVAVDITPQVTALRSVKHAHAEREQLLGELQSASRAKDEFLAMLGHELRNPLSPILTALQLMTLRGIRGAEKEREIIERQVKHVVGLVDDLLDVSRITRGMMELKRARVRLADAVARAIEQASPLIEQRRHSLHVDVPSDLYVDGDSSRLSQVVANLLNNAAKYTEPEGIIFVHAEGLDDTVRLYVRDSGIGIDPDLLPHLFDAFAQERQRSDRSQGGLGLGLAIVRSLVEAHGGSVTLHSEGHGRGAECVVALPRAGEVSPPAEVPAPAHASVAVTGCRVLLVDDNEDAAEMLAQSLAALGHHVEMAFDAPEALDLARRYVPDVALLDLGLPVIDGYELATRLRGQDGWQSVRFAALTGYGQQLDRVLTANAGFDVHLVKPIDLQELDRTIRRLPASNGDAG